MSKAVWLMAPTMDRALRLRHAWELARKDSTVTPKQARTFAGYSAERTNQGSGGTLQDLLNGVMRGGWRLLRAKNAGNHELTFIKSLPWITALSAREFNLADETPWQVVCDLMMETGFDLEAAELAAMHEGI